MTPTISDLTKPFRPIKKYLEQTRFSDFICNVSAKSATSIGLLNEIRSEQPLISKVKFVLNIN